MNIFATWTFVKELKALSKPKNKRHYGSIFSDLGDLLLDANSTDHVLKLGDVVANLNYDDHNKPIKLRVNNSTTKSGKPGGYRVILLR